MLTELFMMLICVPLMALILAFFLKIATEWVVKFEISYWDAYKISLIFEVITVLTSIPFRLRETIGFAFLVSIVQFFVGAVLYGTMIKYPDSKKPIGFGKGLLIVLCVIAILLIISFIVFIIIWLLLVIF